MIKNMAVAIQLPMIGNTAPLRPKTIPTECAAQKKNPIARVCPSPLATPTPRTPLPRRLTEIPSSVITRGTREYAIRAQ